MADKTTDITAYIEEWKKSRKFVRDAATDYKDLAIIANAQYPKSSGKKVNVGDTTVAGAIREMMRGAIKQMPVISVAINGSKLTEQALICRSIVNDRILNPMSFGKGFVNTLQLGGRGALTRGYVAFQTKAKKLFGKYGIVPELIHFADLGIEPGIQEANFSSFSYVTTQMTPTKLKNIYKKEKNNKNTTWNIKALNALIESGPDGTGQTEYAEWLIPSETTSDTTSETFILVTRYSASSDDPILTFSPTLSQPLREVKNRSKFGYPRVLFLVIDPAELSPFGDSRVRLASPNQNLATVLRQNVATTWLYNSDPTIYTTGLFNGSTALKPGGRINSLDPNAKVGVLSLDTTTAQQYDKISDGINGQTLTMLGYNPGANLGAIGKSKTGVGAQTQRMNIDNATKEITNLIQEFIKQYIVSALDLFLSEQDGQDIIYVDDDTKRDIEAINPGRFGDPNNPNALGVDWNQLYDYIQQIDVTVDTTISKDDFTNEKRADLQDTLTVMKQTANPNDPAAAAKANVIEDELLDEVVPDLSQKLEAMQQPQPQPMPQQMM